MYVIHGLAKAHGSISRSNARWAYDGSELSTEGILVGTITLGAVLGIHLFGTSAE